MDGLQAWSEYTRFFIALTAVLDPFLAVPLYVAVTAGKPEAYRLRLARLVTVTVFLVLVGAALVGEGLLTLMGGSLASFRVGGGLVLLLMALAMLNARTGAVRQTDEEASAAGQHAGAGIVPLAIPLLAGPGAISTVIIAVHTGGIAHFAAIGACIAGVCALLWTVLRLAAPIGERLGTTGMNVANRLLGLLLTAIAIETMAIGIRQLFPVLAGN